MDIIWSECRPTQFINEQAKPFNFPSSQNLLITQHNQTIIMPQYSSHSERVDKIIAQITHTESSFDSAWASSGINFPRFPGTILRGGTKRMRTLYEQEKHISARNFLYTISITLDVTINLNISLNSSSAI